MLSNNKVQLKKVSVFLLRISMGWLFFYAGITKVLNPEWSAGGYLKGAKIFIGFHQWLGSPGVLPIVDLLNQWGLTLLGLALILGLFIRISAPLAAFLMLLYYLPILNFPYAGTHSFLIDEHIIYILVLAFLAIISAGRIWGIDQLLKKYGRRKMAKN